MNVESVLHALGVIVVASPSVLLIVLGLPLLIGIRLSEVSQSWLTKISVIAGLTAAIGILVVMLASGSRHVPIEFGNWVSIPQEHFHFHLKFVFDRLSVPFAILSFVLCGTVGAFASVYLHRDRGYSRFFLLYALFLLGMVVSSLAGTIETLFFGWELVGLSSALLVAYFHERPAPVRNGLRVWATYRIADAAFLIAALTMHHLTGAGDFDRLMGGGQWPEGAAAIDSTSALLVGLLLLLAAAGKSGMVPFSGWIPRAMEGPTPSSAIFYGALSVHLGVFLLLRVSPLLDVSFPLQIVVVLFGLVTALFGAIVSRAQSDVKNALAFASLTQVGIITVEIGLGLRYIALIHMIGHACLRTLQLLRAPSILKDYRMLENAVGTHLSGDKSSRSPSTSSFQLWLYRFALDRGFLDPLLNRWIVYPFINTFQFCDSMERRWTNFISGTDSRESDRIAPYRDSLEDVAKCQSYTCPGWAWRSCCP
ncbi:proton-conducting transporter transmembrane domain-containing protein [Bremerella alba]|uniref:NAD(P)H-quinone oxidoreductase subunit 2, chloroplastic n=1 Tax=Bremerella alba TaxID=980252 RepID=A0A7V8V5U9_9BACT|nr:proton-conducting transporter membrane subunit [Bremerella alba]MBA2115316.1 NAD(P)H-quinone oxidoreductase subunit 2, chloroplastic [Bremerella alba]